VAASPPQRFLHPLFVYVCKGTTSRNPYQVFCG